MPPEQEKEQFSGKGFLVNDITSNKEIGFYIRNYMEEHGIPPAILVHPTVESTTVGVPPEFLESVLVFNRKYVHHPHVIFVGNMKTKKE